MVREGIAERMDVKRVLTRSRRKDALVEEIHDGKFTNPFEYAYWYVE